MTSSWHVVDRRVVFAGGPVQEVAIEDVQLPDGRRIPDYYRISLGDFALVFATTASDDVLILRQYKHGLGRTCLTFPGGAIGPGEGPLDAARRELREETGYESERWINYGAFVTNANQRCNTAHLFRAIDCRRTSDPVAPDLEEPELLLLPQSHVVDPDRLRDFGLASHVALLAIATHPALSQMR